MSNFKKSKLSQLKKGEYFRFPGKKKIYRYDGKQRHYTPSGTYKGFGFHYIPSDDVWGGGSTTMTDKQVEIGFTY